MIRCVLVLFLLGVFAINAQAQDALSQSYTPPGPPSQYDGSSLILRFVVIVIVVFGICAGIIWYARSLKKMPVQNPANAGRMVLESTLLLDRRSAVHIVKVDGQDVAITTDASGIKSVVVLTEPFEQALDAAEK